MADHSNEHVLLTGCIRGDPDQQEAFVRHYSNLVFATIHGVVRSKSAFLAELDIEDLHNTVFLRLFERQCRKLRQYQGRNGCSLASWIRMITVRIVLDYFRSKKDALAKPERVMDLAEFPAMVSDEPSPLAQLNQKQQAKLIETGLESLSHRDQLMIRLHFFEGRSLSHVARVLNVTMSNVHSVKHRAVNRLKHAVNTLEKIE